MVLNPSYQYITWLKFKRRNNLNRWKCKKHNVQKVSLITVSKQECITCFRVVTVHVTEIRKANQHQLVEHIFGPLWSWIVCCLHLKIEFSTCARSVHYHWWTALIKNCGCHFPHAGYASVLLSPFLRLNTNIWLWVQIPSY